MEIFWWFRIKGTVIVRIWWQVVCLVLYSAGIVALHLHYVKLDFKGTIIPVMGAVVSLLMGFRTNSAYARYWDGRTIWSQMVKNIRALVLLIWTNVKGEEVADIIEKKSAINLCMAFAVATKHYLRDEFSYGWLDIKDLIFHLQKYYHTAEDDIADIPPRSNSERPRASAMEMTDKKKGSTKSLRSLKEDEVFLKMPTDETKAKQKNKQKQPKKLIKLMAYENPTPSNIPLEILCHLLSYLNHIATAEEKRAEGFVLGGMSAAITTLLETLTNFERVLRTPIPLAYSIHLHHCVWLYLLAVPFQFVGDHHWGTLIIVAIGSFCMLGILSIAYEIEDPFGYDDNDLPLDDFCTVLRREIELITGYQAPSAKDWVYSSKNKPFKYSANDEMVVGDLLRKTKEELRKMLQDNARNHAVVEDDQLKRKHK